MKTPSGRQTVWGQNSSPRSCI
uniref:Uncharacterized protein n=1 Tax=Anguilla anguilla TaxID=7936 RepID=A0A0E9V5N6_ANGAN